MAAAEPQLYSNYCYTVKLNTANCFCIPCRIYGYCEAEQHYHEFHPLRRQHEIKAQWVLIAFLMPKHLATCHSAAPAVPAAEVVAPALPLAACHLPFTGD